MLSAANRRCSMSLIVTAFLSVIVLQWILLAVLLALHMHQNHQNQNQNHDRQNHLESANHKNHGDRLMSQLQSSWLLPSSLDHVLEHERSVVSIKAENGSAQQQQQKQQQQQQQRQQQHESDSLSFPRKLQGVAVTVLFRAPKWFHLRYTAMLHNVLMNLPSMDWALQVFVHQSWLEQDVYPFQPAMQRLLSGNMDNTNNMTNQILVTPLPINFTSGKIKPKNIYMSRWFWNSIAAENVLLFSGNGALCANHDDRIWNELMDVDFCGVPSGSRHASNGEGGGGGGDASTHSWRTRSAMLRVLDYYDHNTNAAVKAAGGTESAFFLNAMVHINQQQQRRQEQQGPLFRIATKEQTELFGGVHNISTNTALQRLPLVVSGTMPRLTWSERDSILKHCPEVKIIFPSLHEPACFGAHPNREQCQATICALQDPLPRQGC